MYVAVVLIGLALALIELFRKIVKAKAGLSI